NEAFTVRKISYGEGVERVFPIYSPLVDSVVGVRKGKVRRAKLYYLRARTGKSARISERAENAGPEAAESGESPKIRDVHSFADRKCKNLRFFGVFLLFAPLATPKIP